MSTSCSRSQSLRFLLTIALVCSLAAGSWPRKQRAAGPEVSGITTNAPAETEKRAGEAYGKLGVSFEENRGQVDGRVRFLSRSRGATVFLTGQEAAFVMRAPAPRDGAAVERPAAKESLPGARGTGRPRRERPKSHAVYMKFEGANPRAEIVGERELPGRVNYLRGSDPSKWRANVGTYGAVRYRGIYEGIDLIYYGNKQGEMEYDFEVAPGADADRISLLIEGAKSVEVDAAGALVINTPAGELRQRRPTIYQEVSGARREVEGGYVVEAGGRVRFALGKYDRDAPLVIDPVLEYSTYLGGSSTDESRRIAVDSSGNAYVTGVTYSTDFPLANAFQGQRGSADYSDAFVTKLSADGSALVYSTYLGGSDTDEGNGIAVDSAGAAHVTGRTDSTDFPVANAGQTENAGYSDAFVAKLSADGSALVYSTYLGTEVPEYGTGIAIDSSGDVFVAGEFYQPGPVPFFYSNVFLVRFYPGDPFEPITFGGEDSDFCSDIAVDSSGNIYLTGVTYSTSTFPTFNALQDENPGGSGAYVIKLDANSMEFVYSTYLGGSGGDGAYGIAADSAGNAYVTGYTYSTDFPLANAFQDERAGPSDAFVTKLNADGSALVYSTYLGGSDNDEGRAVALDSTGSAYVTGATNSADFPVAQAFQGANAGNQDAFVTKLNVAGSALAYSTYLGGSDNDGGRDIAVDSSGDAYVTGVTGSSNFPTAFGFQSAYGGGFSDVFITKLNASPFIRGRVVTNGATGVVGVPWVTVKLTGSQTITKLTDAHGYYIFRGLTPGGDYTVTPSKANLSFKPAKRTFTNLNANINNANFTVPSISVNNVTVTERNAGEVTATFVVKLTSASGKPVTVSYQTINGATNSATAGTDYTALPPTQFTFAPGQFSKTVSVTVKGDTLDEPNETFRLLLSAPTNALISDNTGVCTIVDDDPAPSINIGDATVTEPDAGTVNAVFTVTLSAASERVVTVGYAAGGGTATAGTDYTARTRTTLTFAPGETSKTVTVEVKGDTAQEPDETFFVNLSGAVNASIADAQGLGKITDDD